MDPHEAAQNEPPLGSPLFAIENFFFFFHFWAFCVKAVVLTDVDLYLEIDSLVAVRLALEIDASFVKRKSANRSLDTVKPALSEHPRDLAKIKMLA